MAGNGSEPRRTVTSKVVAIIRSFGPGRSLTITEVAQVADLSVSTTHRLVHELAAWGILHRRGDSRYEMVQPLGPSGHRDRPVDLRAVAASTIEDLSAVTTSDVRLGVIDGHQVLYVEKAHGNRPLSDFSAAATLPAHATALGKALLAFAPPETVDHVIRHGLRSYTASTVATAARLRHVLKEIRLRGIAVAKGELLPGHCAVAVPVFGAAGEVAAALEVRLCDVSSETPTTLPALMIAARGLSRELGRVAGPVSPPGPALPPGGRGERAMSPAQVAVPRLADRLGRRDRR